MKKLYGLFFLLTVLTLVGCGNQNLETSQSETIGDVQKIEMTGEIEQIEVTGAVENIEMTGDAAEEIREPFDATEVSTIDTGTISEEVKSFITKINALIKNRKEESKDEVKLTEEDIDLMENVIEELKNL